MTTKTERVLFDARNLRSRRNNAFLEMGEAALQKQESAEIDALDESILRHLKLVEAAQHAAKTFRWYEQIHTGKGAEDKAARNRREAERLEAVLATEMEGASDGN